MELGDLLEVGKLVRDLLISLLFLAGSGGKPRVLLLKVLMVLIMRRGCGGGLSVFVVLMDLGLGGEVSLIVVLRMLLIGKR